MNSRDDRFSGDRRVGGHHDWFDPALDAERSNVVVLQPQEGRRPDTPPPGVAAPGGQDASGFFRPTEPADGLAPDRAVPRPRGQTAHTAHRSFFETVTGLATERLPSGHLCGLSPHLANVETTVLPRIEAPAPRGPSSGTVAWLLVVGGVLGLLVAVLGVIERLAGSAPPTSCGVVGGPGCVTAVAGVWGSLIPLLGIAGSTMFATVGAAMVSGIELPRRVGLGLQLTVTAAVVIAHGLLVLNLAAFGELCLSCLAGSLIAVPLFWYVTARAHVQGWFSTPALLDRAILACVDHRRLVVACWWAGLAALAFLRSPWFEQNPIEEGTLGAVALISAATVAGAWLATRYASRMGLWLSLASAMMMVTALADILPHVWHESEEVGTPLWAPALALVAGFVVVAFFTRGGCGHGDDDESGHDDGGEHGHGHGAADEPSATARERVQAEPSRSAAFGGIGAAAALTVHRVIEGATIALSPSPAVIAALFVHSASEGLALAALFAQTRRSMLPWLAISVAGPALGVVVSTISPLPEAATPVLLAMVAGVLLRTALVGVKLAAAKRRSGELRSWHIVVAAVAATTFAVLSIAGH